MFHRLQVDKSPLTRWLIMALLTCTGINQCWALRSDREQPIDIKADRVEINEKKEVSEYMGNVHLQQGSLEIKADKIIVYLRKGQLTKITISGNPATFNQKPEDNQDIVKSSAQYMEYFASKEHLVLKTNALVEQGGNHFSGDFIEYDTLNSTVKANKDEGSDSRVHAIIQPSTENNDNSPNNKEQQTTLPIE